MVDAKISFRCPGCDEFIGFPGTEAGTIQECPECGGWVDVPELVRDQDKRRPVNFDDSNPNDEYARQLAEGGRQLEESARQQEANARVYLESEKSHQEWKRQLEQAARYQDQAEDTFRRLADLVARWENLTGRIERKLNPDA